ncbi:hypothetical protein DFJ63DRAFT_320709 [Scheffersomyces coipomensis]|uniref:uncharacterized protein n=1 Tax=Scheffersomyces coipomensis TaxID=1788519 RepID=UPI00315CE83F
MESEREEVGDVADQNDEEMNIKSERIVEEKYDTEVVQSQDEEISNDVKDFVVPQDVDEKSTESNIIPKLSEETTVDDDHYHPEEIEAPNLDTIVDDTIVDDTKNYEDITEHNIEIEIPSKEVEEVIGVGGEVINSAEFDKAPEVEESTVLPEHSETDHITEPSEPSEPSAKELVVVDEQVSQEVTFIEVPELQTVIEDSQHHTEVEEDEVSGNSSSVALGNILENLNEGLESEEVKIGVEEYVEEDVKEDVEEDVEEDVKEDVKEDVDVDVADADAVVEVEAEVKADSNDDKEEFNDEIDNSVDISIEEAKTYVEEEAPTIETNGVEVDQSNKEKHSDDQLVLEVEREEHPVIASNEQVADVEVDDDSLKEQHGVNEETNTMESTSSETKLEEDDVESTNKTETVSTETDTVQEDTSENLKKRKSATDITDAAFKKIRRIFSPFSWNETLDSTQKIIPKPELDEITEDTGPEVEEDQDIEIEEHINREEHETEEVDVIKDEDETDDNEAAEAPSTSDLPAEEPESLEQIVEVEVETKNEEEISTEDKVQDAAVIPEIETHPTHEQERNDDKIGDDLLDPELKIEKNQVQPEVAKSPPRKKKVVLGLEIEEFPIGPRRSLRNGHGYGAGAAPEVVTKDNSTPEPEMINEVTTPKHLIYDVKLELPKRGRRSTQTSPKVADEVISDVKEDHPKRGRRAAKASTESDNVIPDVKLDLPKRNLRGSKIAKEVDNVLPEVKLDIPKRGRRVTQAAAKSPKKVQKAVDLPKRKTGRPFKIAPVTEEDPSLKVPIAEETTNSRRASRRVSRTWDQSEDHPALRTRSRSPIKRSLSEEIAVAEVELSQGTKNLNARRRSSRLQKIEAEPDTVPETVPESEETSITPAEEMRGRGRKRRRQ